MTRNTCLVRNSWSRGYEPGNVTYTVRRVEEEDEEEEDEEEEEFVKKSPTRA